MRRSRSRHGDPLGYVWLAVGGVVVVGGGLALLLGGGSSSPSGPSGFAGARGGLGAAPTDPGVTIGAGCTVKITDLAAAKAAAYRLGLAGPDPGTARNKLFGASCSGKKLEPGKQAPDLFRVMFELWRGLLKGGHLARASAQQLVLQARTELYLSGVSVADLPNAGEL